MSAIAAKLARRPPVGRLRLFCAKECSYASSAAMDMRIPRPYTLPDAEVFNRTANSQQDLR